MLDEDAAHIPICHYGNIVKQLERGHYPRTTVETVPNVQSTMSDAKLLPQKVVWTFAGGWADTPPYPWLRALAVSNRP